MRTIPIGQSSLTSSVLAYGCWRLAGTSAPGDVRPEGREAGKKAAIAAYEAGYTLFDHADVYCDGVAEEIFGEVLREVSGMREGILIADKCGIRLSGSPASAPYRYDFSAEYIIWSCEQALRRLGVETIDIYQLHRPDWLADWNEVAEAFTRLRKQGKVREFGVSNFSPSQVAALQKACDRPLIVHQVEISLLRLACFEDGTLDQCQSEKITPLAWSPLGGGQLMVGQEDSGLRVGTALDQIAKRHGVTRSTLALAWLLRHPSGIVPIVGSTKPERIRESVNAAEIQLSREEWYSLLEVARGARLP
ncbi:MAG: aldo/keto reductase [Verrucomicrobiaceae bacterium]|nr:MAG: aldo/keto reductase [Verrucomicrobiaceae bacterium]